MGEVAKEVMAKKPSKKTASKSPKKAASKSRKSSPAARQDVADAVEMVEELSNEHLPGSTPANVGIERNKDSLEVRCSGSLRRQLRLQAEEEGVSVDELVTELLAEAVTVRAWEILERKNQMRAQPSPSSGNRNHNRGPRKGGRGGMSHGRYQNIMDDKASFLEYVRNQERNRR